MMEESNTSLFANEREANLESTVAMVEDVLIELGHFVNECRRERPGSAEAWTIRKGSASIEVDLVEYPKGYRLRVSATVMTLGSEVNREALFARLLALNAVEITGAAFALQDPEVQLLGERTTLDLDRGELRELVDTVRNFADEFDDKLVEEFGGTLGRRAD
tara:strand:+ start:24458 stop:24943 length:486 start_codon:yes stop_codon:yes gene_type:complete